jgi:ribokinase
VEHDLIGREYSAQGMRLQREDRGRSQLSATPEDWGLGRETMMNSNQAQRILVAGSINMDLVCRVPRLAAVGETMRGEQFQTVPGGKGANQAVAAARLGADVSLLGAVGTDAFGTTQINGLAQAGVDTQGVFRVPDVASGVAMIFVLPKGENSITFIQGANAGLTDAWMQSIWNKDAEYQWMLLQTELPLSVNRKLIRSAVSHGVPVLLDAGGQPNLLTPEDLEGVSVFSPNESELDAIVGHSCTDEDSAIRAAQGLLQYGVEAVALKRGAQGALWVDRDRVIKEPAFTVDPVDTTACGDAWTSGLAVALMHEMTIPYALKFANAAGALAALAEGAQPAMPYLEDVLDMMECKELL